MEEYLVLWARFSQEFIKNELIPEIEKNCAQLGVFSQTAYDAFQKNKYSSHSMYFHHQYANTDIPINQEYEAVAYSKDRKIQTDSIQKCHSKVVCFFTAYKTRPSDHAMKGHHELSLIRFEQGFPSMINELFEITERKPLDTTRHSDIYLGSERVLRRLVCKQEAAAEAAKLLEGLGIKSDEDLRRSEEQSAAIYKMIKKLAVEKYSLEEECAEEILLDGLLELRWKRK